MNLRQQWNDTFLQLNEQLQARGESTIEPFSKDTAARIMAITYAYVGELESFTFSPSYNADRTYIQKRYHIDGGETPDPSFVEIFKVYAKELEGEPTDWAKRLVKERYGFSL